MFSTSVRHSRRHRLRDPSGPATNRLLTAPELARISLIDGRYVYYNRPYFFERGTSKRRLRIGSEMLWSGNPDWQGTRVKRRPKGETDYGRRWLKHETPRPLRPDQYQFILFFELAWSWTDRQTGRDLGRPRRNPICLLPSRLDCPRGVNWEVAIKFRCPSIYPRGLISPTNAFLLAFQTWGDAPSRVTLFRRWLAGAEGPGMWATVRMGSVHPSHLLDDELQVANCSAIRCEYEINWWKVNHCWMMWRPLDGSIDI